MMPLARVYDPAKGRVVTTLHDGYLDRAAKKSDIREYLPYMYDCACSYEKVRVLELGTRKGNSTLAFLAAAEKTGGHVWSNDIINVDKDPEGMKAWCPNRYWTFIHGDDMAQLPLPGEVDVLFIDTSHEYEHTRRELEIYMPRVVSGGTALFHDTKLYNWPGYQPPGDRPPVAQALDEYCEEEGLSWEELPGQYGLGVIRL